MNDKNITTWVLIRDGVVFDGAFDESNGGMQAAESKRDYNNRNYLGGWKIKSMTDAQFRKYMRGNVKKQIEDVELAHGIRFLTRA